MPPYDLTTDPYFQTDATGHLVASFNGDKDRLHVEPHDDGFRCYLFSTDYDAHNGVFATFATKDPREVLALATGLDNSLRSYAGEDFGDASRGALNGFAVLDQHIHNPFADPQYGEWLMNDRHELLDPRAEYGTPYENWIEDLVAERARQVQPGFAERIEQERNAGQGRGRV